MACTHTTVRPHTSIQCCRVCRVHVCRVCRVCVVSYVCVVWAHLLGIDLDEASGLEGAGESLQDLRHQLARRDAGQVMMHEWMSERQ